ncbi:MAG: hypothetical protein M1825_003807 [Sarcosagium campestre]|nr:MAG: hypothetical protein M1825_003807 [Sarcosagium campestre]
MRRMWAGGTLDLVPPAPGSSQSERATARLRLDGRRAVCDESITNVRETGKVGEEKLWVTVERRMRNEDSDILGLVETRDLVFLRDRQRKSGALLEVDRPEARLPRRVVKAPHKATFSNTLIPARELLFRFSALTFNAHAIHLDTYLTRVAEGYDRMLVHGPLTLVLMLEVAGARLRESKGSSWELKRIEYRNLAPLMVEEEMRVCGREKAESGEMEVWVEGPGGSMAARGTVFTGRRSEYVGGY